MASIPGLNAARSAWLPVVVFAVGLALGAALPHTPLHATATDSGTNFATATGRLDERAEGLFCLDFATGNLRGAAINPRTAKFSGYFYRNVLADLGLGDLKNPQFLLVTGEIDFQTSGGNVQRAKTVLYVTETTTGHVAAYAVPWNPSSPRIGAPFSSQLVLLDRVSTRDIPVGEL